MSRRLARIILATLLLSAVPATPALAASPTVATHGASAIATTAATLNGTVNPNGRATTWAFQYGTSTSYGSQTATRSLRAGTTAHAVSVRVGHLTPGVRYHFRLVATNADGTTVGADRSFKTLLPPARPPAILDSSPFAPYANSVTLTATINPDGAQTTYRFQYGTTTNYGSQTLSRTLAAGVLAHWVKIPVSGLQAHTTYHFRVIASNRAGTVAGPDTLVTTGPFPPSKLGVAAAPHVQRRSHPWFVVRGVLRLPDGVSVADGCGGDVHVRFTSGRRTMALRSVHMAAGHCSFRVRMRAPAPANGLLRVRTRFQGNAIVAPFSARSFLVRFR